MRRPIGTSGVGRSVIRTPRTSPGQTASLVRPLVEAVGVHAMAAKRVNADDATVPVLDPDAADKIKTGRL
jgi:hypothetical protein